MTRFYIARPRPPGKRPRFGQRRGPEEFDAGYCSTLEDAIAVLVPYGHWRKGWYVVEESQALEGNWRRIATYRPVEIDGELRFEPAKRAATG